MNLALFGKQFASWVLTLVVVDLGVAAVFDQVSQNTTCSSSTGSITDLEGSSRACLMPQPATISKLGMKF